MAVANQAIKYSTRLKNAVSKKAVNPISTNVDANNSILTRPFKNNALGGQEIIEKRVLGARDRHKNPWNYDERGTQIREREAQMEGLQNALKDPNLANERGAALRSEVSTLENDINLLKTRRDGDPGFLSTTKEMAAGTFRAMNAGSAAQVATKWGAVGAGYMALNGIGRGLSGGGATYDSSGKRDIMGVPFI